VGPRSGLDAVCPCLEPNPGRTARSLVTVAYRLSCPGCNVFLTFRQLQYTVVRAFSTVPCKCRSCGAGSLCARMCSYTAAGDKYYVLPCCRVLKISVYWGTAPGTTLQLNHVCSQTPLLSSVVDSYFRLSSHFLCMYNYKTRKSV
jgi:hypothetical protein